MKDDILENAIVCKKCNTQTKSGLLKKNGFAIRTWECDKCGKVWQHPLDINDYLIYSKLKKKSFSVKLRTVGNSWTVSVPKEIMHLVKSKPGSKLVWHMERPDRLVLDL